MFKGIRDTYQKSLGAAFAQGLLETQAPRNNITLNPGSTANRLVGTVWDQNPHLFDARYGQRPHKMTTAAAAFAYGIKDESEPLPNRIVFALCLARIMVELSVNGHRYPLNGLDTEILESCQEATEEFRSLFPSEMFK
jgi:hypothetical protein